jgi:hypothetical protein
MVYPRAAWPIEKGKPDRPGHDIRSLDRCKQKKRQPGSLRYQIGQHYSDLLQIGLVGELCPAVSQSKLFDYFSFGLLCQ